MGIMNPDKTGESCELIFNFFETAAGDDLCPVF